MVDSKIEHVYCNLCGGMCALIDFTRGTIVDNTAGLQNAYVSGGYWSTAGNGEGALDDGVTYHFSLCEFCLDWLFSNFRIPVKTSNYMSNNDPEEDFRPAAVRVKDDSWRTHKDEFFQEYIVRGQSRKVDK